MLIAKRESESILTNHRDAYKNECIFYFYFQKLLPLTIERKIFWLRFILQLNQSPNEVNMGSAE